MKIKKIKIWLIFAVTIAALCFISCDRNGGEEEGGGGSGNQENPQQEYPPTADVIRDAVTDIDGNKYDAVRIGDQVWMASNLRTTRYADGTIIPLGDTSSSTVPYRYAPGEAQTNEANMANVPTYGYLYNWSAVMHNDSSSQTNPSGVQGICPNGWHVPSEEEWDQLRYYLYHQDEYDCSCRIYHNGEFHEEGGPAKALASTKGWLTTKYNTCAPGYDQSSNNATGFSAFPAGFYSIYDDVGYDQFGWSANFWSSTSQNYYDRACRLSISNLDGSPSPYDIGFGFGFSVRCLRD